MSDTPETDFLSHYHICTICEKQYLCEEEGCDETDDTAICEECLEDNVLLEYEEEDD